MEANSIIVEGNEESEVTHFQFHILLQFDWFFYLNKDVLFIFDWAYIIFILFRSDETVVIEGTVLLGGLGDLAALL